MQPACANPGCHHNGVVTIPVGHGRTASRLYLCGPHFEVWLASLRVRKRWPCAIDGCVDMEHLDGLCERHWVTLRGADEPGTPAESTTLHRFTVRHRRPTLAMVADAPDPEDTVLADKQAPEAAHVARLASRLARSAIREVVEDVAEAARLLKDVAARVQLMRQVQPRQLKDRAKPAPTQPPTRPVDPPRAVQGSLFGFAPVPTSAPTKRVGVVR